jgi:zeta-carotene isomerase
MLSAGSMSGARIGAAPRAARRAAPRAALAAAAPPPRRAAPPRAPPPTPKRASLLAARAALDDEPLDLDRAAGEDAAAFDLAAQSASSWALFAFLLALVGAAIFLLWIAPGGPALGSAFVASLAAAGSSSEATMLLILLVFGVAHSGLAFLRPWGEAAVGARAYRVFFALVSLPLALAAVAFFINHRYDGAALWNLRGAPGLRPAVWATSFASFFFLYPSTFNILEVAAVDEPQLHLWETGIARVTRHPQAVGQLLWCLAHAAWIGSSFMLATSAGLMAHHAFGVWHGDFRLRRKHGAAFDAVKARTSIVPFAAILDGRQTLPEDYYKEFLRAPYFFLVPFCVGAYLAHPLMQRGALWLGW